MSPRCLIPGEELSTIFVISSRSDSLTQMLSSDPFADLVGAVLYIRRLLTLIALRGIHYKMKQRAVEADDWYGIHLCSTPRFLQ